MALMVSVLNAVVFTVFAYVTTHLKIAREGGSPWQPDPYHTVVTFTMFFVPILMLLILVRVPVCRRNEPLPLYRASQLLRASGASALLVTATYITDWVAVAAGTGRPRWDSGTPWLIAVLGLVSGLMAVDWLVQVRSWRLLPHRAGDQACGDWLDDARLVAALAGARWPRSAGRLAGWLERTDAAGWIRSRFTLLVAAASLAAGLAVATALARENGFSSLFFSETIWFAGGMYAFGVICDAALQLTVRPTPGRLRRAVDIAVTAGALALPVSLALRNSIWSAAGLGQAADTPGQLAAVTFASALLASGVVFAVALARTSRR